MDLEHLKYPVGRWQKPQEYPLVQIQGWINELKALPGQIESALDGRGDEIYTYRYRPGGWTLRQLIHHVADSHMNAYVRHKLAFTENQPRICAYLEQEWAKLEDVEMINPKISVVLLGALHTRWTVFLESIQNEQWDFQFLHPEHNRLISLKESVSMYAWHSRHHLAHIKIALSQPS
ncbi:MAG: putative metal-dependent hydrolase [Saprospiraceae bacterium]|nr:putative metal-dependent hydrolase [Saprospiraceae bacterium]